MDGTDTPKDEQISIAIIGAGVSSLCLARGLLQYKHINVRIYEARSEIGHDGSGFGISGNGQTAMRLIDSELVESFQKAGGVKTVPQVRFMMGNGPRSGEHIADCYDDPLQITVRRSRFLTELKKLLPEGVLQTGRRLLDIKHPRDRDEKVSVTFEDGLQVAVDAVVGCDGINSFVRRHVLDADHPAVEAKWTPGYNTRIVIPMTEAISIFGPEYCKCRQQTGWIGEFGFCMTDTEDDGNAMQVIAGFVGNKPVIEVFGKAWVEVEKEFWTSRLKDWGWIGEKISQVVEGQDKVFAASGRSHDETPTYCNGRLCIAGDAAGAFPPFRSAGAGQGIEDAMMLYTVLGCVDRSGDIDKAFKAYDHLRRPRRTKVANASWQAAKLLTGRDEGVGIDVEKLQQAVEGWNDWIYGYDLEGAQEEARRLMKEDCDST